MTINCEVSSCSAFVYWQCQIRKYSARKLQAQPTSGVCPELVIDDHSLGVITTLLVPEFPENDMSNLKHIYDKTFDPQKRRKNAIKYLQSEFYQFSNKFNGELTALAAGQSKWIDQVITSNQVKLYFDQDSQQWQFPCQVELLDQKDAQWQFTLAHNQLFNHTLTTCVQVLLFKPIWGQAVSD